MESIDIVTHLIGIYGFIYRSTDVYQVLFFL